MRSSSGSRVVLVVLALLQGETKAFNGSNAGWIWKPTPPTEAATTPTTNPFRGHIFELRPTPGVMVLRGSTGNSENDNTDKQEDELKRLTERATRINGSGLRGQILQLVALSLSVWIFTIPPDLRRYNMCSERDTIQHPDICISPGQFGDRLADYYKDGFKVQWDFSVGERTKTIVNSLPGVENQF